MCGCACGGRFLTATRQHMHDVPRINSQCFLAILQRLLELVNLCTHNRAHTRAGGRRAIGTGVECVCPSCWRRVLNQKTLYVLSSDKFIQCSTHTRQRHSPAPPRLNYTCIAHTRKRNAAVHRPTLKYANAKLVFRKMFCDWMSARKLVSSSSRSAASAVCLLYTSPSPRDRG